MSNDKCGAVRLLIGGSPCTHWKSIPGYGGKYEVSESGKVRNHTTGRILRPKVEKNGYARVHLSDGRTTKYVLLHRIVAEAFVPNPKELPTVNHIDEDKSNNAANNLEWADMSYQNSYGAGARARNRAKERPILQLTMDGTPIREWQSIKAAAEALGANASSIVRVCRGKHRYKSTAGFKFRYIEEVVLHG